jgi:hypothetical protein
VAAGVLDLGDEADGAVALAVLRPRKSGALGERYPPRCSCRAGTGACQWKVCGPPAGPGGAGCTDRLSMPVTDTEAAAVAAVVTSASTPSNVAARPPLMS